MMTAPEILDPPDPALRDSAEMWVQEDVFGHRVVTEQLPFMLVLEVLAICRDRALSGQSIFPGRPDGRHEDIRINIRGQAELRYLLFRDSIRDTVREGGSDADRFDRWIEGLNTGFAKEFRRPRAFDYLAERFPGRCDDLLQAVDLLRGLEVDALSSRRWTSRFLVPRGPAMILQDVDTKLKADRRFFGRGGELVYLMLNRGRHGEDLGEAVKRTFLDRNDPMNRLAEALSPEAIPVVTGSAPAPIGLLPHAQAAAYERMAKDWLRILSLPGLPPAQKLEPLGRVTALNFVRYLLEVAAGPYGQTDQKIPLDMLDGAQADLRQRARVQVGAARETLGETPRHHVAGVLQASDRWANACVHPEADEASKLAVSVIDTAFHTSITTKAGAHTRSPGDWHATLDALVEKRSRANPEFVVEPLGKNAGFIHARRRVGTWFGASDGLLEALVYANVGEPVTIEELSATLFARYGLIIGPAEADAAYPVRDYDIRAFEKNLAAFERRLATLSFVKRLSDDCAFVSNPMIAKEGE